MVANASLWRGVIAVFFGLALYPSPGVAGDQSANNGNNPALTLSDVLALVRTISPELRAANEEVQARNAEIAQSDRAPVAELSLEIGNFAGSGAYSGIQAAETTLQISRPFERGGKRQLRRQLAEVERDRAALELAIAEGEVQALTARTFWSVAAAQERLKLSNEQVALAQQSLLVAEERIAAGKVPEIDRHRFQGALAEARLSGEKAALALTTARRSLAALLGREGADLVEVNGNLAALPPLPDTAALEESLRRSPGVQAGRLAGEAARLTVDQAQTTVLVEPTLSLGVRNLRDSGDTALLVGVSLPLGAAGGNRSAVEAANRRRSAIEARTAADVRTRHSAVDEVRHGLAAGNAEARVLRDELLPQAEAIFAAADFGYRAGKSGVLEVKEALVALAALRERYLAVLLENQLAAVELSRLLGVAPTVRNPHTANHEVNR